MSTQRKMVIFVVYAVLALSLDMASGSFVTETGMAICYPPAGLYMAAILLWGWRALPLAFLNPLFSFFVTLQNQAVPLPAALLISALSMIAPAIVLGVARRLGPPKMCELGTLRAVVIFLVAVLGGVGIECIATATAYVSCGVPNPGPFWEYASGWWISNVLPCVSLTPVLLLAHRKRERYELKNSIGWLGLTGFVAIISTCLVFVFHHERAAAQLYFIFLPVVWGAISAGVAGGAHTSLLAVATALFLSPHAMNQSLVLLESQMFLLVLAITGLIVGAIVSERRKSERALREGKAELSSLFTAAPINFCLVVGRTFLKVNDRFCQLVGYAEDELVGHSSRLLYESDEEFERMGTDMIKPLSRFPQMDIETRWVRKDGTALDIWVNAAPLHPGTIAAGITTVSFDITERKQIEDRLRRSQKMEAVGTLAGGIAHDFNNILAAMFGFVELAKADMTDPKELTTDLDQVQQGLNRAKELVQQILAFSRGLAEEKHPVQIGLIAKEILKLLRAATPSTIEIRHLISSQAYVESDPTQIHQVILNLCTNACHAMQEKGGVLGISLTDIEPSAEDIHTIQSPYTKQVLLEVSDTGHGMSESVKARIFDPYFTTKTIEKGTGLGLAIVHGIVTSHKGHITVESELGEGSTFRVFLPALDAPVPTTISTPDAAGRGGAEHILFVDDEESILQLASKILPRYGYRITICRNGIKALHTFALNPRQFDLVCTDITMPRMNGLELARKIRATRPDIPVILCSGYSEIVNREKAVAEGFTYLQKPLKTNDLLTALRSELDKNMGI